MSKVLELIFGLGLIIKRNQHTAWPVWYSTYSTGCTFKGPNLKNELKGYSFHAPGKNYEAKNYLVTENTYDLLKEHINVTGGKVRTRFPPEPNGLLHIGHVKAISISFQYAEAHEGICFLRFDDTNPETEENNFAQSIQHAIKWLGFVPHKVTYASDYFPQLYDWAVQLIKKNVAFVCHEAPLSQNCHRNKFSLWRDRPINESIKCFEYMKEGKYKEGEATLRLKLTTDQRIVDPVAYRIKYLHHYKTKDQWCIYPTYDFAHGLCDSIENITHSFCSTEFALRRSTYYWLCNALDIYCPVQIEFGRLNFLYTVTSKRKIMQLIETGHVEGWDDPRLFTMEALKRRGLPADAINAFCENLGFNQQNIYVDPEHLQFYVRKFLNKNATRVMAVLNPLKVVISNYPYNGPHYLEVNNISNDKTRGIHTTIFDKELWIERDDFKEDDENGYRRLTPTQGVGLKHSGYVIYFQELVRNFDGKIDYIKATCAPLKEISKPKAYIHWVSNPISAEVRIYENLFIHEKPDDLETVPEGFLSDINPNSKRVVTALVEQAIVCAKHYDKYQFERVAYFGVDPSSTQEKFVFNKIVDLKQNRGFKS